MSSEKEPMFSAKNLKLLSEPLGTSNPITIQELGICSALAVTVKLKPSIVLAISVMVVMAVSNVVISLMRKSVPPRIRIIVQLVVIATMVILVDQVLKAYAYDVSKQLSVFVGLIIVIAIVFFYFSAQVLKTHEYWRSSANKHEKKIADLEKKIQSLRYGEKGNPEQPGLMKMKSAVYKALLGRGRVWYNCRPQMVKPEIGAVRVTTDFPNPHGIPAVQPYRNHKCVCLKPQTLLPLHRCRTLA